MPFPDNGEKRRFKKNEDGVSAVEFALILPVLITITFAGVEFALILFTYNAAGHAAWSVTRALATNRISAAQVDGLARGRLPSWIRDSAMITPTSSSSDPKTNEFTVTITFPASAAAVTGLTSWAYKTLSLRAATTMRQEPTS